MPAILATSAVLCPGHANLLMATSDESGLQVLDWSAHSDDCEVYLTNYDDSGPPGTGQTCNLRALPRNWALGGSVLVLARTDQGGAALKLPVHAVAFTHRVLLPEGRPPRTLARWASHKTELMLGAVAYHDEAFRVFGMVEIDVRPPCPRPDQCATNFQVGFVQNVRHNERIRRYKRGKTEQRLPGQDDSMRPNLPQMVRDAQEASSVFTDPDCTETFLRNHDEAVATLLDNPGMTFPLQHPRHGALQLAKLQNLFVVWLAVANREWQRVVLEPAVHFLCHFSWRVKAKIRYDPQEGKFDRASWDIEHTQPLPGKGAFTPNLDGAVANYLSFST